MRNVFFKKFIVALLILGIFVVSFAPQESFAQITSNLAGCSWGVFSVFSDINCLAFPVAYVLDFVFSFVDIGKLIIFSKCIWFESVEA